MTKRIRSAATCRWATSTLFLPSPYWLEAERCPWTCVRGAGPAILTTTNPCASCSRWEPRSAIRAASVVGGTHFDGPGSRVVPALDWFGAFRPPHEIG